MRVTIRNSSGVTGPGGFIRVGQSGVVVRLGGSIFSPTSLGAKILRWSQARAIDQFAVGTTAGSGAVSSGGTAGYWADLSSAADGMIQSTVGLRPVVKTHASGRGCAINGSGEVGAGGKYLAGASSVTGLKYMYGVVTFVGPNTTRTTSQDPVAIFNDGFHGAIGGDSVVLGSTLITGNNATSNLVQHSLSDYTRNATTFSFPGAAVGYGRKRYVYRVTCNTTMTAGKLAALKSYVQYDGYHLNGSLHELMGLSASASAADLASLDAYFASYWLSGYQIIIAGDSLSAGYNLTETQGPAALIHEAYNRCIPCPTIAYPGIGVTQSVSPITDTMSTVDPAKIAAMKDGHTCIIVALAGTNDLAGGRTAAQLLVDMKAYTAAAKALGHKVIVGTIAARSDVPWTGAMETQRVSYNSLISADHAWADGFVDVATIGPALQADNVHWTATGTANVYTGAGGVKSVIDTLLV